MNAKKNGVKIWASGRISCSSSSCASVSATMRPATNAPMIAASPTNAETSASANISMNAGTSGVSANSGQVNTSRFRPRARRAAAKPSPISPNADSRDEQRGLGSSPVAAPVTSPMAISARMSSITAAPRTTRANVRSSTPSSPRTRLVIPMLVAHSARPTNAAVSISAPIATPSPMPAAIGRIIAMTAVSTAGRPTASRSSRRTSSPTENNRMITPSSEKTAAVSPGVTSPSA